MGLFGVFIELAGRSCLVVGGGAVGTRKAESLIEAGARVTVVSREITPELRGLVDGGRVDYIKGSFAPGHLSGVFLCISAMDERSENEAVARACREHGVLVNVVDDPELSDFIFPSLVRRGDLVIAVSSGGVAPSMVKRIRRDLEEQYGREYGAVLVILGRLRERLKEAGVTGDYLADAMGRAAALPLAEMMSNGRDDEIIRSIRGALADGGVRAAVDLDGLLDDSER
jgi:precorrin-2 dehydrogenase/sirohydrochlorin ferrochelatase